MTGMATRHRPRRRWIWVLVTLVTATVVVVPVTLRVALKGELQHESDPLARYRREIADLQVQANDGEMITVQAGRPGQVTVTSMVAWLVSKPAVTQSWRGGVFRVSAICPKFDPFEDCQASVVISVPAGTTVQGQAGAGSLTVVGLTGALHLTATSGLVLARNVSGPVWAAATSGSAVARTGLRSASLHASVSTGLITLMFTAAPRSVAVGVGAGSAAIAVPAGSRYRVAS
ncbi:MAG: hypothetical protein WBH47_26505 [Streptosporangiaceae bacterium]